MTDAEKIDEYLSRDEGYEEYEILCPICYSNDVVNHYGFAVDIDKKGFCSSCGNTFMTNDSHLRRIA